MRTRILLVIAAILAGGWQAAGAQSYGKIEGTVMEAGVRKPVSGATVTVKGTKLGAVTDPEGNFSIGQVPPGLYTLTVSRPGFRTQEVTSVKVQAGQRTLVPRIFLEREPVRVYGIVKDARTGRPIPDAIVQISGPNVRVSTKTDAKGRFEFPPQGIDPTEVYGVHVSAEGYRLQNLQQVFADPENVLEVSLEPDVKLSSVTVPIRYRSVLTALAYVQDMLTEYGNAELASAGAIRIRDTRENLDRIVGALKDFDRPLRIWVDLGLIRATEKEGDSGLGTLPGQVVKQLKSLFRYRGYQVLDSGGSQVYEEQPCELVLAGGKYKLKLEDIQFVEGDPRIARMKVSLMSREKGDALLRTAANIPVGDTVVLGGSRVESPNEALIVVLSVRELK